MSFVTKALPMFCNSERIYYFHIQLLCNIRARVANSKGGLQKNHNLYKYGFADVEMVANENKT